MERFPLREHFPRLEIRFPRTENENAMIKVMLNVLKITVEFILSFRLDRKAVRAPVKGF